MSRRTLSIHIDGRKGLVTRPAVSIVIPVFNGEETIARCLESVLRLNYPKERLEVIVVDNASTDRTLVILETFEGRVTRLFEPKKGPSAARNCGIRRASGEVIAFTDADCIVDEDWLHRLAAPLSDFRVGAVGGKNLAMEDGNYVEKFGEQIHDHERAINVWKPPYVITMNWASRREVLRKMNCFDEGLRRGEDVDLSFRLVQAGYSLVYEPQAVIYHRNETTLRGLFIEGYSHGLHLTKVSKRHKQFLRQRGYRRFNVGGYREILRSLGDIRYGLDLEDASCRLSFNVGKKVGKLAGSGRYFHLDL